MPPIHRLAPLASIVLLFAQPTLAIVRHVPADYPTIQAAIDAAVRGDVVEVQCGVYAVPEIRMKSGITLRSASGSPDCVILEPDNPAAEVRRLLQCDVLDGTTLFEGVTFRNGRDPAGGPICFSGSPRIRNCRFVGNSGKFLPRVNATLGEDVLCGTPGGAIAFYICGAEIEDCEFVGNSSAEGAVSACGNFVFVRCTFTDNWSEATGGAISAQLGALVDCEISNNFAGEGGGAFADGTIFQGCVFRNNESKFTGGGADARQCGFSKCTFVGNRTGGLGSQVSLSGGGGLFIRNTAPMHSSVSECTFVDNDASPPLLGIGSTEFATPLGSALLVENGAILQMWQSLVVGNTGSEAVHCGTASVWILCSNIFGNPAGDWTGCIADDFGVSGNISVDPMFCDATGGDLHLSSLSPCLYAECGTLGTFGIGALGQGCFDDRPALFGVKDVGNDQGRQVRLTWQRSDNDSPTANPFVVGYAVYRKRDQFAKEPPGLQTARGEGVAILGWDYLGTVPSRGDSVYETVAPTLCDSTITDGQCVSTFFISAMTSNPFVYWDSPPHDGYSKDNLAPPTPTGFAIAYNTGDGNHLVWDAVAAADFAGFRVYRSGSLVGSTTQTSWTDPDVDGWSVPYEVTSFDLAGNESAPATGGTTTAVPLLTSQRLELLPNIPNPFNPTTEIRFTTPMEGPVRIAIYDARGSLVRVLVDKAFPAGHHDAVWDGRDGKGATVSSGVYLVRLEQRSDFRTRKIVLIK